MSPPFVVLAFVVLASCGSSLGVTPRGLEELMALDVVLWDLREALDAHSSPDTLPPLSEAPTPLHNGTLNRNGGSTAPQGKRGQVSPDPEAENTTQGAAPSGTHRLVREASGRRKRLSPTPPPYRPVPPPHQCRPLQPPPAHLGSLEQMLYLLEQWQQGCDPHHHGCHGHSHCPVSAGRIGGEWRVVMLLPVWL